MENTMRAVTVYGPQDARIELVKKPEATGDMIVAKVLRTGVCATDLSIYTGDSSFIRSGEITYPCRFGHEWAGVVESVGPDVKDFKPGDRVYADNFVSCGLCPSCLAGDYMACSGGLRSVGTVNCWEGCYAEYMQMPERHVYHLPDALSMDEGALIEPGSIAYDAFKGVTLSEKDTAVVFGTGAIGMIAVWLAKYYGAGRVILVGLTDEKLAVGKRIGADETVNGRTEDAVARIKELTGGKGASFIVEASGAEVALKQALSSAARYARISLAGFYEKNINDLPIDPLVLGCLTLVGAAGCYGNATAFCEILCRNPVKLTDIVSHHIPFERVLDIFEHEKDYHKERIKAMIAFDSGRNE